MQVILTCSYCRTDSLPTAKGWECVNGFVSQDILSEPSKCSSSWIRFSFPDLGCYIADAMLDPQARSANHLGGQRDIGAAGEST